MSDCEVCGNEKVMLCLNCFEEKKSDDISILRAENRAAWEGWDRHRNWAKAFWAQNYGDVSIVLSSMEERYGPRPTDAAKEVGNES